MSQDNEIEKFEPLAEQWFDKDGPLKTLHDINPIRLNYVEEMMALNGCNIADIGCGAGIFSESAYLRGAAVKAIDLNRKLIEVGKKRDASNNFEIDYELCSSKKLATNRPGEFDLVACFELIEHVEDVEGLLSDCETLLKNDGVLIVSTINRTLSSLIFGIIAAEKILKIVPNGTHSHEQFIRPNELTSLARNVGLYCTNINGFVYNPFLRKAKLSKSVAINYFAVFSK